MELQQRSGRSSVEYNRNLSSTGIYISRIQKARTSGSEHHRRRRQINVSALPSLPVSDSRYFTGVVGGQGRHVRVGHHRYLEGGPREDQSREISMSLFNNRQLIRRQDGEALGSVLFH